MSRHLPRASSWRAARQIAGTTVATGRVLLLLAVAAVTPRSHFAMQAPGVQPIVSLSIGAGMFDRSARSFTNSAGGWTAVSGSASWGPTVTVAAHVQTRAALGVRAAMTLWRGSELGETLMAFWVGPDLRMGGRDALRLHVGAGWVKAPLYEGSSAGPRGDEIVFGFRAATGLGLHVLVGYERSLAERFQVQITSQWTASRLAVAPGERVGTALLAVRLGMTVALGS